MKLKVKRLGDGPGPGEAMVEVETIQGISEQVIVSAPSIAGDAIEIGYPIMLKDDGVLVELPMETMSGRWRVWVRRSDVRETAE